MANTNILNRVMDSIFDDAKPTFTKNELDIAIKTQLVKVMSFITHDSPFLEAGLVNLYLLLMVQIGTTDVQNMLPEIGISNQAQRAKFDRFKISSYELARQIYDTDRIRRFHEMVQ